MGQEFRILKFIAHSHRAIELAAKFGWYPGARYTNLRDVARFEKLGFLDIDWKNYNFKRHIAVTKATRPFLTVARDVIERKELPKIIGEAEELAKYAENVVIVPKDPELAYDLKRTIPAKFVLGFSVPSRYGNCPIDPLCFKGPVHLLGGRPDVQRRLADKMSVVSFDCNRFTLDARYGDYFDGEIFRPHPKGGYERCLIDSIKNINALWINYEPFKRQHRNY